MHMRKGEVWVPEYGFRGELYIVNTANKKMAVVYPQGDSDEEKAIASLIAAAPEMLALLDQAHSALQMAIDSKKTGWFQDAVLADIGALLSRIEGETE